MFLLIILSSPPIRNSCKECLKTLLFDMSNRCGFVRMTKSYIFDCGVLSIGGQMKG